MRVTLALILCLASPSVVFAVCYDRDGRGIQKRFALSGDEAFDTKTGLTWKRCSLGTTYDGVSVCKGEKMFLGLDAAMRAAKETGDGWRVPSGPELESLIDRSCGSPVVDQAVFPDISADEDGEADYWTTNAVGMANLFYYFDFMTGRPDGHSRGYELGIRLVKTGR
jgi:hypothetical protein